MNALNGATSEGLRTTVQPAASAGADGLAHDKRVADALFPLELARELCVVGEVGDRQCDLDAAGELERHADFLRDRARELVRTRFEARGDLLQVLGALLHRRG